MTKFIPIDKNRFNFLINELRKIQKDFLNEFKVDDIFSNSKIYEIIIANELNHILIPGHSGSKDAQDSKGTYEYKHFKETSSNHSWTFNDYSDQTINNLTKSAGAVFAHIDDTKYPAIFDWYIFVDGPTISKYLKNRTDDLLKRQPKGKPNDRRMINISANQLENDLRIRKNVISKPRENGKYSGWIKQLYNISHELERCTNIEYIMTSNKIWETLVAVELNHNVNSEQGGRAGAHDAFDINGNLYEYKVSKTHSWNFQDISDNVLNKYLLDSEIILAVVDKTQIKVDKIYSANSKMVVSLLHEKLKMKKDSYKKREKELRRLQVSLTRSDLEIISAIQIV